MAEEQKKEQPYVLTPAILDAAVASKDVERKSDKVTAEVGGKKYERPYTRLIALTPKGCGILVGSSARVVENFNYAFDLGVRNKERQALLASIEGPEKQLMKGVASLMKLGYSEMKAKTTIVEGLEDEQYAALPEDWQKLAVARFEALQAAKAEQPTTDEPASEQAGQ